MSVSRGDSFPRWVPWALGGVVVGVVVGILALRETYSGFAIVWGDIPTWLGSLGATAALGFGAIQYAKDRAWRRVEFLASEMRAMFEAQTVRTATLVLDYAAIRLNADGNPASDEEGVVVHRRFLVGALRDHTAGAAPAAAAADEGEGAPKFTPVELVVRRSFDDWFTRLERVQVWLEQKVVKVGDLEPYLGWYLQRMFVSGTEFLCPAAQQAIRTYLARYKLSRVLALEEAFRSEYGPNLAPSHDPRARPDGQTA